MLYGTEFWVIKKHIVHRIRIVEMRMLRWINGNIGYEVKNLKKKKKNEGGSFWLKDVGVA